MSAPADWLRAGDPSRDALLGPRGTVSAAALARAVDHAAAALRDAGVRVLATRADNGPDLVVADLAAWTAGVVHVPLPSFFTDAQVAHVLQAAGADALATDCGGHDGDPWPGVALRLARRPSTPVPMPAGTVKVSFTSGSTGQPKGVCLSGAALARVAEGVAAALRPVGVARHLAALPLPILLENVAGLYAPLAAGAAVVVAPLTEVGLEGSSRFDAGRLQAAVERWRPDSTIVLPQMLRAWAASRGAGGAGRPAPRLVAVGGAAVGAATLAAARAVGLPAYEGYGLTECGSVQTMNLPGADRPGSAGRALPHARVRIAADGEVLVAGTPMLGYLGGSPCEVPAEWPSGDLGHLDADGFLHLSGRRRNILVTAYGRNVSPEWVETALQSQPAIAHAVVLGDGSPVLSAVLWPARADASRDALAAAVRAANATLPDYARIGPWVVAAMPFDPASGTATPNGRPLRAAIETRHRAALAAAARGFAEDVLP